MDKNAKNRVAGKGNKVIAVRLNGETELALNNGMKQTGLTTASYTRMAIIEKSERDKKCK
jgi:predicted DNA-binding protein